MQQRMLQFFLMCIVLLIATRSWALPSSTIDVNAVIQKGCLFQQSPIGLNFGTYPSTSQDNAIQANIANNQQSWRIECTPGMMVTIRLDAGKNSGSSPRVRRLKHVSAEQYINYLLYWDSNLSQTIGTGLSNNSIKLSSSESNHLLDFQIYAVVDLSQGEVNKLPGLYQDEVVITLTW